MITEFEISGIHCYSCMALIKMNIEDLAGIDKMDAIGENKLKVKFNEKKSKTKDIINKIEQEGYKVVNFKESK